MGPKRFYRQNFSLVINKLKKLGFTAQRPFYNIMNNALTCSSVQLPYLQMTQVFWLMRKIVILWISEILMRDKRKNQSIKQN